LSFLKGKNANDVEQRTPSGSIHHAVSIGCTIFDADDTCPEPVVKRAASALYLVKSYDKAKSNFIPHANSGVNIILFSSIAMMLSLHIFS
jgi:GGDEF domain-containing protein